MHKTIQNNTGTRPRKGDRALAVELVAVDSVIDQEIAQRCGISRRTLAYWKKEPAFVALVNASRAAFSARILAGYRLPIGPNRTVDGA